MPNSVLYPSLISLIKKIYPYSLNFLLYKLCIFVKPILNFDSLWLPPEALSSFVSLSLIIFSSFILSSWDFYSDIFNSLKYFLSS